MTIKVKHDPSGLYYYTQCDKCTRVYEVGRKTEGMVQTVAETEKCECERMESDK